MVKVGIIGHIAIDEVVAEGLNYSALGGVPIYAGLAIASLGHSAIAFSRVGGDFGEGLRERALRMGINLDHVEVDKTSPTTRFRIINRGGRRELFLLARCGDLKLEEELLTHDAVYLGPVAWEISYKDIDSIIKAHELVALDPQGLVRDVDDCGKVILRRALRIEFIKGIDVLRLSDEEASFLGFTRPLEAAAKLSSVLSCIVIVSSANRGVFLCDGKRLYHGSARAERVVDSVGAGDVLGGAFLASYVATQDVRYSLAIGISSALQRLSEKGPHTLDERQVRTRAEQIYEGISMRKL